MLVEEFKDEGEGGGGRGREKSRRKGDLDPARRLHRIGSYQSQGGEDRGGSREEGEGKGWLSGRFIMSGASHSSLIPHLETQRGLTLVESGRKRKKRQRERERDRKSLRGNV